ncbi:glucosidase 2 subunit beta [Brachionus plicatilis]|uniref:Glucosidase 2 subunit beta n=1 Tax=Brachionus plicatilis TaxID=10195 RepID=A0A3M7S0K5_BRAPC|nr:glucosidase 2 subunit beta [Brachionus plicatilis]
MFQNILILLSLSLATNCDQIVRGISPERASLYDPNKPFTCLDGSLTIPFSQINDDYCDCRDGSDEPGTAACMNGQFACQNLDYIVQYIPSSRVNDGICDCCDGSDEYSGKVQCENKCVVLAAKMREEEEKMRLLREQGFAKRQELIMLGEEFKKTLEAKVAELEDKKSKTESEKNELEAKKNEAESKANEAKSVADKILEEKAREEERAQMIKKANELFDLLDLNKDSFLTPSELVTRQELDILFDNDGKFTIEESIQLMDNSESVNLEVFISGYYDKLSPHVKVEEQGEEQQPEAEQELETTEELEIDADQEPEAENVPEADISEPVKTESKYDAGTQKLIDESNEARRLFENSERDSRNIEREIEDINKKLELDLGPKGEFASMIDKCFEFEDREYIYKLCPFDRTVQKSKSNHGETSIGNWKSWGDGENKYLQMRFDNGLGCWNGPQRSTNVIVTCGIESKLTSVAEPNRCEYEMKFETPAVCEPNSSPVHEEL